MFKKVKSYVKKFLNPSNMFEALSPLFKISFLIGFMPYKLDNLRNLLTNSDYVKENTGKCSLKSWWNNVSKSGFTLTLIHLILYLYSLYTECLSYVFNNYFDQSKSKKIAFLELVIILVLNVLLVMAIFITKIFLSHHVDNMMVVCREIDELLLENNVDMKAVYRKSKMTSMIILLLNITAIIIHWTYLVHFLNELKLHNTTYLFFHFILFSFLYFVLTIVEYMVTLFEIRLRYDKLHEILDDLIEYIKDNYHRTPIAFQ